MPTLEDSSAAFDRMVIANRAYIANPSEENYLAAKASLKEFRIINRAAMKEAGFPEEVLGPEE